MGRISFKRSNEEHNFWQNYTDLMSGFLIVFIIASLVAYSRYKAYVDIFEETTNGKIDINAVLVQAELYKKIREFQDVSETLGKKSQYFHYNPEYKQFECILNIQFDPTSSTIKDEYKYQLLEAGKELDALIMNFEKGTKNIAFKIIIDGRAANNQNPTINNGRPWVKGSETWEKNEVNSYRRARAVKEFWQENNIFLEDAEHENLDIIVSGSGFGGKNRNKKEDDNKTFTIQIIPYINNLEKQ